MTRRFQTNPNVISSLTGTKCIYGNCVCFSWKPMTRSCSHTLILIHWCHHYMHWKNESILFSSILHLVCKKQINNHKLIDNRCTSLAAWIQTHCICYRRPSVWKMAQRLIKCVCAIQSGVYYWMKAVVLIVYALDTVKKEWTDEGRFKNAHAVVPQSRESFKCKWTQEKSM